MKICSVIILQSVYKKDNRAFFHKPFTLKVLLESEYCHPSENLFNFWNRNLLQMENLPNLFLLNSNTSFWHRIWAFLYKHKPKKDIFIYFLLNPLRVIKGNIFRVNPQTYKIYIKISMKIIPDSHQLNCRYNRCINQTIKTQWNHWTMIVDYNDFLIIFLVSVLLYTQEICKRLAET